MLDVEGAIEELNRSPALGLIVNVPPGDQLPFLRLAHLSNGTPMLTCWVPGRDEAARRLGVGRYLVKPVTRGTLLSTVDELAQNAETVLLVDDEAEVLQLFTRIIRSASRNYQVLRAQTGQQALTLLRERRPDLMLLDLVMPGMDGWQVLREKNQDTAIKDIPVAVVSSRDPSSDPVMSDSLTVTRDGGLSVPVLLDCVRALTDVLAPSPRPGDRVQPETPPGLLAS